MAIGKRQWIIPDCELPEPGEGVLKGHESVIVVNDSEVTAVVRVTLFFSDKECHKGIVWEIAPQKVRCFRNNNLKDMCGFAVPFNTQYAMKLESNTEIVVQYGRLDNRQTNLAYYTTMAYGM
ncbi:hypothetical protein FACS1894211_07670 [Clostridia bacterium]|nr:hypothetical protein FACS1894211_07670 [Clostridia bacterium]